MKHYITYPRVAGVASRQAHADLPAGTFEREMSKDGFFGPAAHLYHRHPPTGWVQFAGPLRPHAFDLAALPAQPLPAPLEAAEIVGNARAAAALLEERRGPHGSSRAQRRRR